MINSRIVITIAGAVFDFASCSKYKNTWIALITCPRSYAWLNHKWSSKNNIKARRVSSSHIPLD